MVQQRKIQTIFLPLHLVCVCALSACGGGGSAPAPTPEEPVVAVAVNHIPIAADDSGSVDEGGTIQLDLAANDGGLEDAPIQFSIESVPMNGTVLLGTNGSVSYAPNAGFFGQDSFTYTVTDADGESATATVDLMVIDIPDAILGQVAFFDSFDYEPVADATVTLLHNNASVQTDAEGRFRFDVQDPLPIAEDVLAVSVAASGYRPREVNVDLNSQQLIELNPVNSYSYFSPVQLSDGISTADIGSYTNNAALVYQLMQKFVQENESLGYRQMHSLLVYKDGALILEEYNFGNDDFIRFEDNIARDGSRPPKQWSRTEKHYIASVNKALTSTVAGIAMDAYNIEPDDKISMLLPEKANFFFNPNKAALSLHHMLTMQLGLTWDEWGSNDLALLWQSNDFTDFVLSRSSALPGSSWVYNSASPNMLLRGLNNTVDGGIRDWAHTNFYSKLGITDYSWLSQPDGIPEGAARMHMRPRDMLKVGITYLNNGVWNGEQVIPEDWVSEVSKVQVEGFAGDYSYFFWHRTINGVSYLSADGDGGQYINIFPEQNMVVVMTQGNYLEWPLYVNQANDVMGNYLLPALSN